MAGFHYKYMLFLLLAIFSNGCSEDDGNSANPYYFVPYVPDELPNVTYQSEISWFENIAGNDVGSIVIYNERTDEQTSAQINSKTECFNVIWLLFLLIPIEETCLADYSYIATVPLDIGINQLTFTATDIGGTVAIEKSFSVERVDFITVSENEPNHPLDIAENVLAPTTISGEATNEADYFLLTAEESREYTILITSEDSYAAVAVYNLSLDIVADSDDTFFSGSYAKGGYVILWLNVGEQVYVDAFAFGSYILGIY